MEEEKKKIFVPYCSNAHAEPKNVSCAWKDINGDCNNGRNGVNKCPFLTRISIKKLKSNKQ